MSKELTLLRTDGTQTTIGFAKPNLIRECEKLIGADVLDTVNLRDGRVMLVDDLGHQKGLPDNAQATALYHAICRPGTTHRIVGDAVIARDKDFIS